MNWEQLDVALPPQSFGSPPQMTMRCHAPYGMMATPHLGGITYIPVIVQYPFPHAPGYQALYGSMGMPVRGPVGGPHALLPPHSPSESGAGALVPRLPGMGFRKEPHYFFQGRGSDVPSTNERVKHIHADRPHVHIKNERPRASNTVSGYTTQPPADRDKQLKKSPNMMEDKIKRTVYISSMDFKVTEADLAVFFSDCGRILDCRICGDLNSAMRFAFIEFQTEEAATQALGKTGVTMGKVTLRVLRSKTAIMPVSQDLVPRSPDDIERCGRTVYVTNIDKSAAKADVHHFFEQFCGKISKLRLLGDDKHPTRMAFVEFRDAEAAVAALNCSGVWLVSLPIRVSPSKTPVCPKASNVEVYDNTGQAQSQQGDKKQANLAGKQAAGGGEQAAAKEEQADVKGQPDAVEKQAAGGAEEQGVWGSTDGDDGLAQADGMPAAAMPAEVDAVQKL